MKVLILIEISSLGGHVLSALTTGRELKKRSHEVHFAGGSGPMVDEIQNYFRFTPLTYFYNHGTRQTYFTWASLKTLKQLSRLVDREKVDHIHAFDARSYIIASLLALKKKIPVTGTLCGGITPYYPIPRAGKLIVFSREQKDKLTNVFGWKPDSVEVINSRLDMEQFLCDHDETISLCKEHGIDPSHKNIVMITNFLGPKIAAIRQVLEAIQPVALKFPDVRLVLIGSRGDFFDEAREIGNQINQSLGRKAVIFTGQIMGAHRVLPAAFAVMGVGRSAFEGMAYLKPTLIVGERGYAGTVCQDNIEKISYYNFSGRNNRETRTPSILTAELEKLLTDPEYLECSKSFGRTFLEQQVDIKRGISRIEAVYEANGSYAKNRSALQGTLDMLRTLSSIMIDNYYNQFKQLIRR